MIATDTPIVLAFGMNVWDEYWQTRQHGLSRLAGRGWNVGYTTPAMSIWERGGLRWRHASWLARTDCRDGVRIRYPGRLPLVVRLLITEVGGTWSGAARS